MTKPLLLLAALLLAGCDIGAAAPRSGQAPIVRASDGATASVTLVACPTTVAGGMLVQEVINMVTQYGSELAIAQGGGTARLVINTCPNGTLMLPGPASTSARAPGR